ncbi:MAG TPA: DUF6020 family protein [Acidimicrobiia bacterium]|nr:DUF6020 family protein [Acidimicrobiia bacterium]
MHSHEPVATADTTAARPVAPLLLAGLAVIPLLVWWAGWYPGILTSDSVDQLGQVERFEFFNYHPWFHTFSMWLVTRVWDSAGVVSLAQVLATGGLFVVVSRRLIAIGVSTRLAIGTVLVVASLPMVGATTISLWKDVPFSLAVVWAFAELLALARDADRFWSANWPQVRLGAAFALMWLFRHNGMYTVVVVVVVLAIAFRQRIRDLWKMAATTVGMAVAMPAILMPALDVEASSIEPAQVFVSDLAASYHHEPTNFGPDDLELLTAVAPLEVWDQRYSCLDSTPLAFDPEFDETAIKEDPWSYRWLVIRSVVRDLDTVLGHRVCAASYLVLPSQPDDGFFHRPPFDIAENDLGIVRAPLSDRAFDATFAVYRWIEPAGRLWFTWRPALAIWLGIATYLALARRRRLRPLLWPGLLFATHLLNVAATTPAQEFRFAYPLYLVALLGVPLLSLATWPERATLAPLGAPGRR